MHNINIKTFNKKNQIKAGWCCVLVVLMLGAGKVHCTQKMEISVEQSEEIALSENAQLRQIEELYMRSKQGKQVAIADYLPKLEAVSEGYRTQQKQHTVQGQNNNSFLTQLSLTQALLSTDKFFDIKIAELLVKQLEILLKSMVNDILFEVRDQYYKLVLIEKQTLIAQSHVEILSILSRRVDDRFTIGTATSFEVNQSKVALSNSLSAYYKKVKERKVNFNQFSVFLGFDPGRVAIGIKDKEIPLESIEDIQSKLERFRQIFTDEPVKFGFIYAPDFLEHKESLVHQLFNPQEYTYWEDITLKKRPALLRARNAIAIASKEGDKMKGRYAPEMEFVATLGGLPTPYQFYPSSGLGNQNFQWGVGVNVRWLLFDSLKRERKIKMASLETSSKRYALTRQVQEAFKDVRDEIAKIEDAVASFVTSEGSLLLAEQMVAQAEEKVEIGTLSIFDYQYAVDSFIEAENIFTQSQYDLIQSYIGLRHASGIDVEKWEGHYGEK
ncbi:hypothetical protein COB21_04695 [Candidatus Aerophobetes bacterium]|uniref:TolC family protein n=1 Tax=Aerophobetes bacterium TaxID=2030807 RepID=A0A2A4X1L1_UNCAE|nr:MAG: hypothetical protein COB21_04695 [Candidatus Aerophobetes bacterium]